MNNILTKFNLFTNNKFFIALLTFFLIVPMGIVDFMNQHLPMTIIRLLLCIIVLIKYLPYLKENKKVSPMTIVAIMYCLGRFIITYISSHNITSSLLSYSLFTIIILFMFVECTIKNNTNNLIEGILIYCETIIYINFICLLFPKFGQFFDCGFILENDNNQFIYYILGITSSFISHYLNNNKASKIRMITLCSIVYATALKLFAATTIVALVILALSLFLSFKFNIGNIVLYIIFYLVVFIAIVIFNAQYLFAFLIVDILHKSLTLSLREYLWRDFKAEIIKSPIIGHGYHNDKIFSPEQNIYLYAHNHILQELYNGGIVMYLIYIWFVILPAKKLYTIKDNALAKALSSVILAILVHGLCESLSTVIYTFVFCLIYYVDVYVNKQKV